MARFNHEVYRQLYPEVKDTKTAPIETVVESFKPTEEIEQNTEEENNGVGTDSEPDNE